ncbi:hypothetical protein CTAYLR_002770 [Chrysophaeum taylorii]|uniref:Uncharacterized protein n=1 Tax=Chrysophaeum taylorii TaxID=2483200 RepID=A0AAD7UEA5_9STRA|nr:hypothetical protein CTAYLR_002770 [Chrysophaeum taylorii]
MATMLSTRNIGQSSESVALYTRQRSSMDWCTPHGDTSQYDFDELIKAARADGVSVKREKLRRQLTREGRLDKNGKIKPGRAVRGRVRRVDTRKGRKRGSDDAGRRRRRRAGSAPAECRLRTDHLTDDELVRMGKALLRKTGARAERRDISAERKHKPEARRAGSAPPPKEREPLEAPRQNKKRVEAAERRKLLAAKSQTKNDDDDDVDDVEEPAAPPAWRGATGRGTARRKSTETIGVPSFKALRTRCVRAATASGVASNKATRRWTVAEYVAPRSVARLTMPAKVGPSLTAQEDAAAAAADLEKNGGEAKKGHRSSSERRHSTTSGSSSRRHRSEHSESRRSHHRSDKSHHRHHKEKRKAPSSSSSTERPSLGCVKKYRLEHETFPVDLEFRSGYQAPCYGPMLLPMPKLLPYFTAHRWSTLDDPKYRRIYPEPLMGLTIDILNEDRNAVDKPLDPADRKIFELAREVVGDEEIDVILKHGLEAPKILEEMKKGKQKKTQTVEAKLRESAAQGAVWLKNTTYLSNNLHESVHSFKSGAAEKKERAMRGAAVDNKSYDDAVRSFELAAEPLVHATDPSLAVEWAVPLFPDASLWANTYVRVDVDREPPEASVGGAPELLASKIFDAKKRVRGQKSLSASVSVPTKTDDDTIEYAWSRQYQLTIRDDGHANDRLAVFVGDDEATYVVETAKRVELDHCRLPRAARNDRLDADIKAGYHWNGQTTLVLDNQIAFDAPDRNAVRRKLREVSVDVSDDEDEEQQAHLDDDDDDDDDEARQGQGGDHHQFDDDDDDHHRGDQDAATKEAFPALPPPPIIDDEEDDD